MIITKKTAGKRKPQHNDLQYTLQELQAAGIPYNGSAFNMDGQTVTLEKAGEGASVTIQVFKSRKLVFALAYNGKRELQEFKAFGKRPESFKRVYVASYGALVKKNGYTWSVGKIMGLIESFFESARLESEVNKKLRQQGKKEGAAASGSG